MDRVYFNFFNSKMARILKIFLTGSLRGLNEIMKQEMYYHDAGDITMMREFLKMSHGLSLALSSPLRKPCRVLIKQARAQTQ
jgi:hypothetical protein